MVLVGRGTFHDILILQQKTVSVESKIDYNCCHVTLNCQIECSEYLMLKYFEWDQLELWSML